MLFAALLTDQPRHGALRAKQLHSPMDWANALV